MASWERERTVRDLYRLIHPDRAKRVKRAKKGQLTRAQHRAPVPVPDEKPGQALDSPSLPLLLPGSKARAADEKTLPGSFSPDSYQQAIDEGKRRWESEWGQSVFGFLIAVDSSGNFHALPPGSTSTPELRLRQRFAPQRQGGNIRWRIDPIDSSGKAK